MKLLASTEIEGVVITELSAFSDSRGWFAESFRTDWFPNVSWEELQCNRSESRAGTLRGLHFHRKQVDYWHCVAGRIRVGLYDLRRSSPTYGCGQMIQVDCESPQGLFIPVGVAHGFFALTDVILTYVVNHYYNAGGDEFGLFWNDPSLGLNWEIGNSEVIVSARDQDNPKLCELNTAELPE